jgi:transcription elongation factor GreA
MVATRLKNLRYCRYEPIEYIFVIFTVLMQCLGSLQGVVFFFFLIKGGTMSGFTYFTKDALSQLKAELQKLKSVERQAASKAIAEAREKGDLRENAEYDAAKEAQGLLEAKIQKLESDLANARVIDEGTIDTSKVSILTKVTVTNLTNKKQMTYHLVSEKEADLKLGKISVTSPIGKGLLGKHVGDTAQVQVPAGTLQFKIENITV